MTTQETFPTDWNSTVGSTLASAPNNVNDPGSILNVIYLIVLIATTLIGNVGNVLVVGAVVCDRKLRSESNVFIVNLAIADLCVTSIVDPFSVAGVLVGHQWFLDRPGLCHALGSICLVSCVCSLWSIAAISLNRFILLCRHSLYKRLFTWSSTIQMSLSLWGVAILLDLPNFLDWGDHTYDMKTMACSYDRTASYSYTVFFITLFVTLPLIVVIYCNVKIYIFVVQSKIRVASHSKGQNRAESSCVSTLQDTTSQPYFSNKHSTAPARSQLIPIHEEDGSSCAPQELRIVSASGEKNQRGEASPSYQMLPTKREVRQEVKLAKTLFVIFLVFCVCWGPYALICLIDRYDRVSRDAYTIAVLMAHSSSTLNSVLYGVMNKRFRNGYKSFLAKCLGRTHF